MKRSNHKKLWKTKDIDFLADNIGEITFKTIAKKLGRTETACITKANCLKLGSFKQNTELITMSQAAEIIGVSRKTIYNKIKDGTLNVIYKNTRYNYRNPFLKFEDVEAYAKEYKKPIQNIWTPYEVSRLKMFIQQNKTVNEIAKLMNRSVYSVEHKIRGMRV